MAPKVVYVLTSDSSDYYLEQLVLSIYSLRLNNPELYVEVVMDEISYKSLDNERLNLLDSVNKITSVCVPMEFNKMQKSRWIKTNLRNLINGDYLFLDTDTIVCNKFNFQEIADASISAVRDLHVNISEHAHKYDILYRAKLINWQIPNLEVPYHNSGVMWVKDNVDTRSFYKQWNEEWIKSMKAGCSSDQPSLCKVNQFNNNLIRPLDDKWNCQITENGIKYLNDAIVLHYFASGKKQENTPYLLNNTEIYKEMREYGVTDHIKEILNNPKSAFFHKVQLLSDTDITFYQSPLCQYLRRFFYSSPCLFNNIVAIGRKFKHI